MPATLWQRLLLLLAFLTIALPVMAAPVGLVNGWEYRWGDPLESGPHSEEWHPFRAFSAQPEGRAGHRFVWYRVRLPAIDTDRHALSFVSLDLQFEAYVDGELVSRSTDFSNPENLRFQGHPMYMIPLRPDHSHRLLEVRIFSDHANIGIVGVPVIGPRDEIILDLFKSELDRLCMVFLLVCTGIVAAAVFVRMRAQRAFGWFALLCLCAGIYAFTRSPVKTFFVSHAMLLSQLELFSLYILPMGYAGFIHSTFQPGILHRALVWLFGAFTIGVALFHLAGGDILKTLLYYQLTAVGAILASIISCTRAALRKDTEARMLCAGLAAAFSANVIDILKALAIIPSHRPISHWGFLVLVGSLAAILVRRVLQNEHARRVAEKQIQQERLEQIHRLELLVAEGQEIASRTTLAAISAKVKEATDRLTAHGRNVGVLFHSQCLSRAADEGFYSLQGDSMEPTPTPPALTRVEVRDPRDRSVLGMIVLDYDAHDLSDQDRKALEVIATNTAAAIATVRLNDAFALLFRERQKILSILTHINEAVFLVDANGRIDSVHSPHLCGLAPGEVRAGASLFDTVLSAMGMPPEKMVQIAQILETAIGEPLLTFELNAPNLPRSHRTETEARELELDWIPVTSPDEMVESCLLAIRDITSLMQLRDQAMRHDAELRRIGTVLAAPAESLEELLRDCGTTLTRLHEALEQPHHEQMLALCRDLHTAKGGARTLQFDDLAQRLHALEAACLHGTPAEAADALAAARAVFRTYGDIRERLRHHQQAETVRHQNILKTLADAVSRLERSVPTPTTIATVRACLLRLQGHRTLSELLPEVQLNLARTAQTVGLQKAPELQCDEGEGIILAESALSALRTAFLHLTNNSLAHGVWHGDQRDAIRIGAHLGPAMVTVRYCSTGDVLDMERIRARAPHLTTDDDVAEALFAGGLSTAEQVSTVSGRGLGMGAVREAARRIGGEVALRFTDAASARRSFFVEFQLPCKEVLSEGDEREGVVQFRKPA